MSEGPLIFSPSSPPSIAGTTMGLPGSRSTLEVNCVGVSATSLVYPPDTAAVSNNKSITTRLRIWISPMTALDYREGRITINRSCAIVEDKIAIKTFCETDRFRVWIQPIESTVISRSF